MNKEITAVRSLFMLIFGIIIAAFFLQIVTAVIIATNNNKDYRIVGQVLLPVSAINFIGLTFWARHF